MRYTPVKEVKIHQTSTLSVGLVLRVEEVMEIEKTNNKSATIEMLLQRGLESYFRG
jgi:hypothetical protein